MLRDLKLQQVWTRQGAGICPGQALRGCPGEPQEATLQTVSFGSCV